MRSQPMSESESSTLYPARSSGTTSAQRPAWPLRCICRPSAQKRPAPAARNSASAALPRRCEMPTSEVRPSDCSPRAQLSAKCAAFGLVNVATSVPLTACAAASSARSAKRGGRTWQRGASNVVLPPNSPPVRRSASLGRDIRDTNERERGRVPRNFLGYSHARARQHVVSASQVDRATRNNMLRRGCGALRRPRALFTRRRQQARVQLAPPHTLVETFPEKRAPRASRARPARGTAHCAHTTVQHASDRRQTHPGGDPVRLRPRPRSMHAMNNKTTPRSTHPARDRRPPARRRRRAAPNGGRWRYLNNRWVDAQGATRNTLARETTASPRRFAGRHAPSLTPACREGGGGASDEGRLQLRPWGRAPRRRRWCASGS